jgi:hypothetical protein
MIGGILKKLYQVQDFCMELKIMGVEATLSSLKIIFECYLEHPVKP